MSLIDGRAKGVAAQVLEVVGVRKPSRHRLSVERVLSRATGSAKFAETTCFYLDWQNDR